jgi:hypothetical protein
MSIILFERKHRVYSDNNCLSVGLLLLEYMKAHQQSRGAKTLLLNKYLSRGVHLMPREGVVFVLRCVTIN